MVLSPLASAHPDGLEWVAGQKGFLDLKQSPQYNIIPHYVFPGISNHALVTIASGIIGTLLVVYSQRKEQALENPAPAALQSGGVLLWMAKPSQQH